MVHPFQNVGVRTLYPLKIRPTPMQSSKSDETSGRSAGRIVAWCRKCQSL